MDHSLNSLNNFDFWRVVLPECTQKVARSIFWPLLVTWMKNIEPGFAHVMPGIANR